MTETKRCGGYKKHWECAEDYPDHMVPKGEFGPCYARNGLQGMCRRCRRKGDKFLNDRKNPLRNPRNNAISAIAARMAGGYKVFYELSKENRIELRRVAADAVAKDAVGDTTPRHKSEFGQSTPMTKRETTVVEGEQVPEGWVYVVYNPDVPSVLKIGKTFPDGIPSIMSSARRFGRAELADKFWFSEAYKAEQAIHTVLSDCNLRSLGYSDCGVELFKCNLNDVRGAVENAKH
jgi:hypothetical protein